MLTFMKIRTKLRWMLEDITLKTANCRGGLDHLSGEILLNCSRVE